MENFKKISFETEGITVLNATEMYGTMGGSTVVCASSVNCIGALTAVIGAVTSIITAVQSCEDEVAEDTTSRIIVEGMCELDPSYCYSYA